MTGGVVSSPGVGNGVIGGGVSNGAGVTGGGVSTGVRDRGEGRGSGRRPGRGQRLVRSGIDADRDEERSEGEDGKPHVVYIDLLLECDWCV